MANIKNLTMGSQLLSDPRINTVSTLFGLSSKAVYVPTGSKISSSVYEYSAQEEDKLKHLLPLTGAALADAARNVKTLKSHDIGNLRLEVCLSPTTSLLPCSYSATATSSPLPLPPFLSTNKPTQPLWQVCCKP